MNTRAYQTAAFEAIAGRRLFAMLWERQAGKSTTQAKMAFGLMMALRDYTVVYASASLLLSREIIMKLGLSADDIMRQEARVLADSMKAAQTRADAAGMRFETSDAKTHKILSGLTTEDLGDLFQSQRLEFRVYHTKTRYSRTKVIAPNPATARGWSGTVLLDEVGFIPNFQELWTAIEPIISTQPKFRLILSTTPPQDDRHYSYELLSPQAGTEFAPNAAGNWYDSETGIPVHRADCFDTHLAGKRVYDVRTGAEITPEEAFRKAVHKDGHRLNHQLQWLTGGTSAVDLHRLKVAQERGATSNCQAFVIDSDADFQRCLGWLALSVDPDSRIGIGLDIATTTKATSNPTALSITEDHGSDQTVRAILTWKTRDPAIATDRVKEILRVIARRPGGRARALAIDATSEKYFAEALRRELGSQLPVLLVVASEAVKRPGLEKPTNWKELLGDGLVDRLDNNRLTVPPQGWVKIDWRLVLKDRGRYVCEPNGEGQHGDTFDSTKLSIHALFDTTAQFDPSAIRIGRSRFRAAAWRPRRLYTPTVSAR